MKLNVPSYPAALIPLASGEPQRGLVRYLQHWLSGTGTVLQGTDFVPQSDPMRQWADTFPWDALVDTIEQRFAKRFPQTSTRGRRPVPIRVLLALELLN